MQPPSSATAGRLACPHAFICRAATVLACFVPAQGRPGCLLVFILRPHPHVRACGRQDPRRGCPIGSQEERGGKKEAKREGLLPHPCPQSGGMT